MATQVTFNSDKEKALYKIKKTQEQFAAYLEATKEEKAGYLRIFVQDDIPSRFRPNCYQVKFDHEQQKPVLSNRPRVDFNKNRKGKKVFGSQTYDQAFTEPGIYYYENLKYWGNGAFSYAQESEGYFLIDTNGEVKRVLKSEANKKLLEWEKQAA